MGNYEKAVFFFTQAIEDNPKFTLAYLKRAQAHIALHNHYEAMDDYRKALEIDADFTTNYFSRNTKTYIDNRAEFLKIKDSLY